MSSYGILSDEAIKRAVGDGSIQIDPYNQAQVNPASYDLTLGDEVAVYRHWVEHTPDEYLMEGRRDGLDLTSIVRGAYFDIKKEPEVVAFKMNPEHGWVLKPGIGYLMHTRECIWTEKYVPIVDGKSSIGRLFILVHFTAGFGDPNFRGQYTLEVSSLHPVRIYPGMRIAQIRFHTICGEVEKPYAGNYVDDGARGAVASRAWKQFRP